MRFLTALLVCLFCGSQAFAASNISTNLAIAPNPGASQTIDFPAAGVSPAEVTVTGNAAVSVCNEDPDDIVFLQTDSAPTPVEWEVRRYTDTSVILYATAADVDRLDVPSGYDFCAQGWITADTTDLHHIAGKHNGTTQGWQMALSATGLRLQVIVGNGTTNQTVQASTAMNPAVATPFHVGWCYDNSEQYVYFFEDGKTSEAVSTTVTGDLSNASTAHLFANIVGSGTFNGAIRRFEIYIADGATDPFGLTGHSGAPDNTTTFENDCFDPSGAAASTDLIAACGTPSGRWRVHTGSGQTIYDDIGSAGDMITNDTVGVGATCGSDFCWESVVAVPAVDRDSSSFLPIPEYPAGCGVKIHMGNDTVIRASKEAGATDNGDLFITELQ